MKKSGLFLLPLLALLILINGCESEIKKTAFRHKENIDLDHGLFNYSSIIEGDAHSGKKFSRADVGVNFNIGYSFLIPDSLKGKSIAVTVDGWVRTGDLSNTCDIAVTATSSDVVLLWTGCNVKEFVKNPNEWTHINKTIVVAPEITAKDNVYLNVLGHNIDAKSFFDVDDLTIEYLETDTATEPVK